LLQHRIGDSSPLLVDFSSLTKDMQHGIFKVQRAQNWTARTLATQARASVSTRFICPNPSHIDLSVLFWTFFGM
jgi:hypothetical protein